MAQVLGEPIHEPPTDGITRVLFGPPGSSQLLVSSWDQVLRIYNTTSLAPVLSVKQRAPVLDAAYPDATTAYCGLLTGEVRRVMLPGGQDVTMGRHDAAIRCLQWLPSRNLLVTGSWDQTLKLWDPRSMHPLVKAVTLPGRVFSMSAGMERLVVATSRRQVLIFDVRKLEFGQPEQVRESSLKYMTRSVAVYADGRGYALGSVEGRVAMELFDTSPDVQALKYAFKCHRRPTEEGKEVVYPVHAIAFHQQQGTFATGAGDGVVNFWDGDNKKRLLQVSRYPTSVSSLAFSPDGQQLAVASSYAWEEGDKQDVPAPAIFLRPVADAEVRPKARAPPPA